MFGSKREITAVIVHLLSTVLPSVMQSVLKVLMLLVIMSPVFMLDSTDVRYPPPHIKYAVMNSVLPQNKVVTSKQRFLRELKINCSTFHQCGLRIIHYNGY
jgi:hypothetical protein